MITDHLDVDIYMFNPRVSPRYRVLLFSRWIDTDSEIVGDTFAQTPIDITPCIMNGSLNLAADSDASTLTLSINLEDERSGMHLTPDLFANCAVKLFEGYAPQEDAELVPTFTGFHMGQPRSSEANTQDARTTSDSIGRRGQTRQLDVTFVARSALYRDRRITTPGVWLPRGAIKNPDPDYSYRDEFDDLGSIVRDIATNTWGLGLTGGEVVIGRLPYRIEKQLQVVQESAMEAIKMLLEPLRLKPYFDGRGLLKAYSCDITKAPVRQYSRSQVQALDQAQSNQAPTNSVRMVGLSSELDEVIYADQRLLAIQGTFGFFDSSMTFRGNWGNDENETMRVKVGTTTDGKGVSVQSPRITRFQQDGFILQPVSPPSFKNVTEFGYEIEISNDVILVVGAIAALIGGYYGLAVLTTTLPEISGAGVDTPNPGAIVAEIASATLLIAGISVLQQIGNFEFEVHGVPFETVYEELPSEASISNFAAFDTLTSSPLRDYERRAEEYENHILSSILDSTTDDGTVNKGTKTWAAEELAYQVAKTAKRGLQIPVDLLVEPGDCVEFDNQIIFIESIQRQLERGTSHVQTVAGFQARRAT